MVRQKTTWVPVSPWFAYTFLGAGTLIIVMMLVLAVMAAVAGQYELALMNAGFGLPGLIPFAMIRKH